MRLRYTAEALQDLRAVRYYIHKVLRNPQAAQRISREIVDRCGTLCDFPLLGASLETKISAPTDYRFLPCEKYIVFYRIEGDYISIERILNGRQDYLHILFQDE